MKILSARLVLSVPAHVGPASLNTGWNFMAGENLMKAHQKLRGALLCAGSLSALVLSGAAAAQDQAVENEDTIVVTGYRQSLQAAQDLKRDAVIAQDSILAEDIADFPDLNVAESLQRIAGVTISRDNGEGRQIALRGLGPEFTRTQINGIETLATASSAFDHRGSASRTRNFDFNIFASELFRRVDVEKSYSASQDEGGIAGTVNLITPKPFDYNGFEAAASVKTSYNDLSEKAKPRLAGLVSNTWGDFGALLTAAYTETDTVEYGYRDWGFRSFASASFGPAITDAELERIGSGELGAPAVATYTSVNRKQERLGLTGALQWQPSDRTSVTLDALYGKLETADREFQIANQGLNMLTDIEIDESDTVVFAAWEDADIRSESKRAKGKTEFYQIALSGDFQLTDRFSVDGVISLSNSEFDQPVFDKIFLQAVDHDYSYDFRGGRRRPVNSYDFDTTDAGEWVLHRADAREDFIANEYMTAELNGAYTFNDIHTLTFGGQYKDYLSSGYQRGEDVRSLNGSGIEVVTTDFDIPGELAFTVADIDATFANLLATGPTGRITGLPFTRDLALISPESDRTGTAFDLTEETLAAYVQHDFVLDGIRGNVGLRLVSTDVTSEGSSLLVSDSDGDGTSESSFVPVKIENSYSEVLPAFNLVFDLSDETLFRVSGSRNISRPNLGDLRAAANINIAGNSITNGNPELEPFIASSFEASVEHYFGDINYIALAAFTKDLQSFIVTETRAVTFDETGLPPEFLTEDRVGQMFNINRPVNGEGGTIRGIELAGQYEFLPGLGIIANYTYADGETTYSINGEQVDGPLLGLSESSYNLTGYYEADRWGVRASAAYRDRYYTGTHNFNTFNGINETTFVDAAAFYNLTDRVKLTLEGINLTNEEIDDFADPVANRPQVNLESGRTYLIGAAFDF